MTELIQQGGPVMWPLLACSVVALAVVGDRLRYWFLAARSSAPALVERLFALVEAGRFEEARQAGAGSSCPAVRMLAAGLADRDHGAAESMEAAAREEIVRMRRRLSMLDTVITLSPLLGILGTVTGIIVSFDLLGEAGIENPKAVTGGIAQALVTTATGLAIAIVALLPFNAFSRRADAAVHELEQLATRFLVALKRGEAVASSPTS